MVTWLHVAMDAAQRDAEAATPGPWEPEGDDLTDDEVYTVHDGEHGDLVGNVVAYARGGWGTDPGTQVTNIHHIARHNPSAVLRRIAADRKLLDMLTGDVEYEAEPLAEDALRLLAEGYGWTEEIASSGH